MMLEKKTKRELALDFFQNFMDEGTSKDEMGVWVSEESLIKMFLEDKEFSNDIDMKNYIDDVINSLKGEKE